VLNFNRLNTNNMTQKAKNRGQLIDIARSYLSGDNHVICREDIPEMIDNGKL